MANNSLFTPQAGFAQSTYYDQMATALPGQLANASDINLVDSMVVGPIDTGLGLLAGLGVQLGTTTNTPRPGINEEQVIPFASGGTLIGVTVRNQQMDSNSNGDACWFPGRMANVLRDLRVGGRIWVRLAEATDQPEFGGEVYIAPGGMFTTTAGTSSANVVVAGAAFISTLLASQAGTIALVEFGRRA